ncbi:helix-turn-helix domain-containing protein [Roseovarius sp. MBR-6]|uniref:helix-turn-helix domain-containing protein n=1 Tax=Roseovarius sp. MBR-6 TaxID=3156459 RepID=UPI003396D067
MPKDEERYLTIEEIAKRFRRHPRTIRDWITKGAVTPRGRVFLDATKPGKSWLVHPDWLALFEDQIRPLGIGTHLGHASEAAGASYRALADGDAAARSWARMRASIGAN